jgi:HEAT repeat protein
MTLGSLEELAEALQSDNPNAREAALAHLWLRGAECTALAPDLIEQLASRDAGLRSTAAEALGILGALVPEAIRALIQALDDGVEAVRLAAANALGAMGPDAREAISHFISRFDDPDPEVRETMARALTGVGSAEPLRVLELLKRALASESPLVRDSAVLAIGAMAGHAHSMVPALAERLHDTDHTVCLHTVRALRDIGPEAKGAVPALLEVLRRGDGAESVLHALHTIAPDSPEAAEAIRPFLTHESETIRMVAIGTLGAMRGAAADAIPDLAALLIDAENSTDVRKRCAVALGFVASATDRHREEAIAALESITDDDRMDVERAAFEALGRIRAK